MIASLTVFGGDHTLDKDWELGDGLQPFHVLHNQRSTKNWSHC